MATLVERVTRVACTVDQPVEHICTFPDCEKSMGCQGPIAIRAALAEVADYTAEKYGNLHPGCVLIRSELTQTATAVMRGFTSASDDGTVARRTEEK